MEKEKKSTLDLPYGIKVVRINQAYLLEKFFAQEKKNLYLN